MNYNDKLLWNPATSNLSVYSNKITPSSFFIYSFECAPLPCCAQADIITWFNTPHQLAGYVKFVILRTSFWLMLKSDETDDDFDKFDVRELLDSSRGSDYEDYINIKMMYELLEQIDKAFDDDEDKCLDIIKDVSEKFNNTWSDTPGYNFGFELFNDIEAVRDFILNYRNGIPHNKDFINACNRDTFNGKIIAEEIEMLMS